MTDSNIKFLNKDLEESIDQSLPWLDAWTDFKDSVEQDIVAFEELLSKKNVPICCWIDIEGYGQLGWAVYHKTKFMALLWKPNGRVKAQKLSEQDLEIKVLVFPYLSELNFTICSKIKLAHLRNQVTNQKFQELDEPPSKREEIEAVFVQKYA